MVERNSRSFAEVLGTVGSLEVVDYATRSHSSMVLVWQRCYQ